MARFVNSNTDIRTYNCQCPSKYSVTVPATLFTPTRRTCRAPICVFMYKLKAEWEKAVTEGKLVKAQKLCREAQEKCQELEMMKLRTEIQLEELEQRFIEVAEKSNSTEEILAIVLEQYSSFIIEQEDKMNKLLQERDQERISFAKSCVKVFAPPSPKLEKIVGKTSIFKDTKRPIHKNITPISNIKKIDQLPNNFTVGETYVSGIATESFGSFGF